MFFQKGDWYEVSGTSKSEVVYADDNCFVSRLAFFSPGIGPIMTNKLDTYSNKDSDFEGKYWIRKIPPIPNVGKTEFNKL
jgi:hypothetical protein